MLICDTDQLHKASHSLIWITDCVYIYYTHDVDVQDAEAYMHTN